jgi:hypothetical protein
MAAIIAAVGNGLSAVGLQTIELAVLLAGSAAEACM